MGNLLEHLDADGMQNDPDVKREKDKMAQKKKQKKQERLKEKAKPNIEAKQAPSWRRSINMLFLFLSKHLSLVPSCSYCLHSSGSKRQG